MSLASSNLIKPLISGGILYLGEQQMSSPPRDAGLRAGAQFISSLMSTPLGAWFHRTWPNWMITGVVGESILVGISFTIIIAIVDTKGREFRYLKFNLLYSFLAELGATWVSGSMGGLTASTTTVVTPAMSAGYKGAYTGGTSTGSPAW